MIWLAVLLLAVGALALAVFLLRLPAAGRTLFAAALVFGLAGYAWFGSPGQPAAPKTAEVAQPEAAFGAIKARRAFFDPSQPPGRFVMMADGYARKGQHADAAALLRGAVADNPDDAEAWVALGNALIEHADGNPTPAALLAYAQAERIAPQNPASAYFFGVALLRGGRAEETRAIWAELIEAAPADAPYRAELAMQLAQLDAIIARRTPPPRP